MKKQIIVLLSAACVISIRLIAQTGDENSEIRDKILGTWRLVLMQSTLKDGSKRNDLGPNGKGIRVYSPDGYMCFGGMDPDRPRWKNPVNPTEAEKASAFDASGGYCGLYEIDARRTQIVHLPEVSTWPPYVGTRQVRPYRFEGDRLIFSDGKTEDEPDVASWTAVWERTKQN